MQTIRKRILEILKERGEASVAELAEELGIAPVSVRHHLDILQGQGVITVPRVRRRGTVGRPQQVYTLTQAAIDYFPNNFRSLTGEMLDEVKEAVSPAQLQKMFYRIALRMAEEMPPPRKDQSIEERLTQAVRFLKERGYLPRWERDEDGNYLIHVFNCPYAGMPERHPELCQMDAALTQFLVGGKPHRLSRLADGDQRCTYRIEFENGEEQKENATQVVGG